MVQETELPRGRWLSPAQQAKEAGISVSQVYTLKRRGELPWTWYPKPGSTEWRADSADIQDWIAKSAVRPADGKSA
ncbi:hypothetical protein FACS189450_03370 [Spirochaetia bacterium]|nr:hypothetical protein FACS189450_03370 [Spirochaetia bacterium]